MMDWPSDYELVIGAQSGEHSAFNLLFERYHKFAERMALRMLGDPQVTQDVLQEAWLQAFLSIHKLRDPNRFRSWLVGIVLNLCRNYLRTQYKDRQRIQADISRVQVETNADSSNPLDITAERELYNRVLAAVQDLPSDQRETVLLHYFKSLSVAEISALTGISSGAARVRLHRARQSIRAQVAGDYPNLPARPETRDRRKNMIEVKILDVLRREEMSIVFLGHEKFEKMMPIWIGPFEAEQIIIGIRRVPVARPPTHNFIASLLETLDTTLEEVRIEALKDDVYFGIARLQSPVGVKEVDARPSDVLALAVRIGCPIYASEEVFQQAGQTPDEFMSKFGEGLLPMGQNADAFLEELKAKYARPPKKEDED